MRRSPAPEPQDIEDDSDDMNFDEFSVPPGPAMGKSRVTHSPVKSSPINPRISNSSQRKQTRLNKKSPSRTPKHSDYLEDGEIEEPVIPKRESPARNTISDDQYDEYSQIPFSTTAFSEDRPLKPYMSPKNDDERQISPQQQSDNRRIKRKTTVVNNNDTLISKTSPRIPEHQTKKKSQSPIEYDERPITKTSPRNEFPTEYGEKPVSKISPRQQASPPLKRKEIPEEIDEWPVSNTPHQYDDDRPLPVHSKHEQSSPRSPAITTSLPQPDFDELGIEDACPPGAAPMQEKVIVKPHELKLQLEAREVRTDTEADIQDPPTVETKAAREAFTTIVGPQITKRCQMKASQSLLDGLNQLQDFLSNKKDLDPIADIIINFIDKVVCWPTYPQVFNLIIDIIRHVVVKSEQIKKMTLIPIFIPLSKKMSDRKFSPNITELMMIIAKAICPSFVLHQFLIAIRKMSEQKAIIGCIELMRSMVDTFGPGSLNLQLFIKDFAPIIQHPNATVKSPATKFMCSLYRVYGPSILSCLDQIDNKQVVSRLTTEFDHITEPFAPADMYYRQRRGAQDIGKAKRVKVSDHISDEVKKAGENLKVVNDVRNYCNALENALHICKNFIVSTDLDDVIAKLKSYIESGNLNFIYRGLVLLEQVAQSTDKGITKYVPILVEPVTSFWNNNRVNIREQVAKTIDALVVHSTPQPWVNAISSSGFVGKMTQFCEDEAMKWVLSHNSELHKADLTKLVPFAVKCADSKGASVKQNAIILLKRMQGQIPSEVSNGIRSLPPSSQAHIKKDLEGSDVVTVTSQPEERVVTPKKSKKTAVVGAEKPVEEEPPQKDQLKFIVPPNQARKTKRMKTIGTQLGTVILTQKSMLQTVFEKTKLDAQTILPAPVFAKLFSNTFADQVDGIELINESLAQDVAPWSLCSDILVRWVGTRLMDKNIKTMVEGLKMLMEIYNSDNQITLIEMEIIVPILFFVVESKGQLVADPALDFIQVIRYHSDVTDYAFVLRSCLNWNKPTILQHIFAELQFTVTDDDRNADYFESVLDYLTYDSVEITASCGCYLSLLAMRMSDEEKNNLYTNLSPDFKERVAQYVPIECTEVVDFESFDQLGQYEKQNEMKKLQELIRTNPEYRYDFRISEAISSLCEELRADETEWAIIKQVMCTIRMIVVHCDLEEEEQITILGAVSLFGNRWQKQLVLRDSIPMLMNAILFKLKEKMNGIQIFSTLLDEMMKVRGGVSNESFFCKVWVGMMKDIPEWASHDQKQELVDFAEREMQDSEVGREDIRMKLLNALMLIACGEPPVDEEEDAQPTPEMALKFSSSQPIKSPAKSPKRAFSLDSTQPIGSPAKPKPVATKESVPYNTRPPPPSTAAPIPSGQSAASSYKADIRERLQRIRQQTKPKDT